MSDPQIEKLLIVQHRDVTLQKIESELARIPQERAALEGEVRAEEANRDAAQEDLRSRKLARKELEAQVQTKEAALQRFRTQQIEVKKNEEYRALTHQIEQTEAEISELEEKEIEAMIEIDEAADKFKVAEVEIEDRIADIRGRLALLAEREKNLGLSISEAREMAASSRSDVDELYLEHYERVKKLVKRAPYIVPIEEHRCGGCHLRVSNEVSRAAMNAGEPHFCDQCARMVFA